MGEHRGMHESKHHSSPRHSSRVLAGLQSGITLGAQGAPSIVAFPFASEDSVLIYWKREFVFSILESTAVVDVMIFLFRILGQPYSRNRELVYETTDTR